MNPLPRKPHTKVKFTCKNCILKQHLVSVPPKQDGQTDEQYQEVIKESVEFKHKVASPHCTQLEVTELAIVGID